MKRLALRGALTAKFGDEAIKVIDTFGLDAIKTRELVGVLGALEAKGRVLVVVAGPRREARAVGPQPADRRGDPRRLAQRGRPPQGRRRRSSSSPPSPGWRRCTRERLTAPEIILRPVISEKSIDESGRGKYTFAVHDDANKIQIKAADRGALREGEGHRRQRQRPDHEGQGEAARHRGVAGSAATPRPGARRSSPWPPARRSNSSRGSSDAAA